ncbi:glycosyltransferase [Pyrococcus furiosus]|uniref:glycosyltransferase n=1 Tax=Pyrococcus furiosus TaxID=2261 RepID=UPI0013050DA5|nr:glycosyltransferase [Pyrococcus furiosus]
MLIRCLPSLPNNVYLLLSRNGRFIDALKQYAREIGVEDRVIFTGDLDNPHIATTVADIYTHITFGEGLPLALLEVMKIGKPIIASKIGGIPEAIRHPLEGILVENKAEDIIQRVEFLFQNPKIRRKMSVISRRAVEKRFSWRKTAFVLLKHFSKKPDK